MKRGTSRHRKTYALARVLNINLAHAVGILEMMWEFCAINMPRGDIGSAPDADIAGAVAWVKRPSVLIGALCSEESQWLDRHPSHRLIVHDWPDHVEYEVCRKLANAGKDFLEIYGKSVRDRRAPGAQSTRIERASREACGLGIGSESSSGGSAEGGDMRAEWDDQWQRFRRLYGETGKPLIEQDFQKAHLIWRILDFEQKTHALVNLAARKLHHDPQFIPNPERYLQGGEYARAVVARAHPLSQREANTVKALEIFKRGQP